MASVLVLSSDAIGARMAGTGIRYWNLARVLASEHDVTLAAPVPADVDPPRGVELRWYDAGESSNYDQGEWQADLVREHEIIVCQDIPYYHLDPETLASRFFAVDLYAPAILEKLEAARVRGDVDEDERFDDVRTLNRLTRLGDFFFCASERQRDFWLGALAIAGRLELGHVALDPELRTLIDCVPFGHAGNPPERTGPGPRSIIAGIGSDDFVLLWNGGLWGWLDPLTAIRAVADLASSMPKLRLVFMGSRRPSNAAQGLDVVEPARQLAHELNVLDRSVYFNDWVPFEERHNWLLDADAAITLHIPTAEARMSFRTRVLDLIWCQVPVITAAGDVLADLVAKHSIGRVVPTQDVRAVQQAVRELANEETRGSMTSGFEALATLYTWERVAEPLLEFCRNPGRVPKPQVNSPQDEYIHRLERLYTETADYASHLEREIERQRAGIEASLSHRASQAIKRIIPGVD